MENAYRFMGSPKPLSGVRFWKLVGDRGVAIAIAGGRRRRQSSIVQPGNRVRMVDSSPL
jgi:hypothetical protein